MEIAAVRIRQSYEVLREAQRDAESRSIVERPECAAPSGVAEREPDYRTPLESHEAARDALTERLDQQMQAGRINRAELMYEFNRFENGTYREAEPAAPQSSRDASNDRTTAYTGDRADMVSQQREAMERLRESQSIRQEMDPRFERPQEATADHREARADLDAHLERGEAAIPMERPQSHARDLTLELG